MNFRVNIAIGGRLLVGVSDALLQPAANSLLTRWFPPSERSYALGLATGGRQIGMSIVHSYYFTTESIYKSLKIVKRVHIYYLQSFGSNEDGEGNRA